MHTTTLGAFSGISRRTLGGGGLGRMWGETSLGEAVATVHAAVGGRGIGGGRHGEGGEVWITALAMKLP